jgi:curli biogenesis system outer membrane secretion channel CsgG
MFRLILSFAVALLMLTGCACDGQRAYFMKTSTDANIYVSPKSVSISKVALLPFRAPTELIGASVSDLFVTEMLRAGRYELVERSQMSKVLGETELSLAGLSNAKAIEAGKMMGAEGVIVGTVDEYTKVAQRGKTYPVVGVSARLIDCQSGKIIWSVDVAKRSRDKYDTLPGHARKVIHEMTSALYQQWDGQ